MQFKWYGKEFIAIVDAEAVRILTDACIMVEKSAKASIGLVPPPSPPGHAPASVSGTLKTRITHEVNKGTMLGRVGAYLPYTARLELGFVGTDVLGRTYNQAPRPFLRPALEKNLEVIKKMFDAK